MGRLTLLLLFAACSGKGKSTGEAHISDSGSGPAAPSDSTPSDAAPALDAPPSTGDISVRVEWKDVPVKGRASPGLTACKTPRAAAVAPTTTWGIPDALVFVDGAATPALVRVVLAECALGPRVGSAASLVVASAVDRPSTVTVAKRGTIEAVVAGTLDKTKGRTIQLPIAGHAVTIALEPGAVYELATTDTPAETAWITTGAAVTDASGVATLSDLAPGEHAVIAWLPPRAGQPARVGRGTVTVEAGDVADLTLQLE